LHYVGIAALIAIPNGISNVFDAIGWRRLLPPKTGSFFHVFTIHFSAEVIVRSIPGGIAIADSVKVLLLKRECGVPPSASIASAIWRRWFLGISQSVYLFIGAAAGFPYIYAGSIALTGNGNIAWAALAASVLLTATLLSLFILPAMKLGGMLLAIFRHIPGARLRAWIMRKEQVFAELDTVIAAIKNQRALEIVHTVGIYFCVWIWETIETYIYMLALGFHVAFFQAMALETLVSAMRLIMFFLPSGAGVQELGYAGLMVAFGIVPAAGDAASFMLLKRARDIAGISLGYAILLKKGIKPTRKMVPKILGSDL